MILIPTILYEDETLLVICKPPGMVVNRADTVEEGETLQDWVESHVGAISQSPVQIFRDRSGIAHRLDKETSGVMVIGKTSESLAELMRQFKERETEKEYLALVHGKMSPSETIVNLPIKRSVENRHKFRVDVFGKSAVTGYKVEQIFDGIDDYQDGFTLVRLFPKTGRTHQIRVHMAHLGYSLVGDELYGGRKRSDRDRDWCPRHFLHAATLRINHPYTNERVQFDATLPNDLQKALDHVNFISHE